MADPRTSHKLADDDRTKQGSQRPLVGAPQQNSERQNRNNSKRLSCLLGDGRNNAATQPIHMAIHTACIGRHRQNLSRHAQPVVHGRSRPTMMMAELVHRYLVRLSLECLLQSGNDGVLDWSFEQLS